MRQRRRRALLDAGTQSGQRATPAAIRISIEAAPRRQRCPSLTPAVVIYIFLPVRRVIPFLGAAKKGSIVLLVSCRADDHSPRLYKDRFPWGGG
jgi:hypothetical protein